MSNDLIALARTIAARHSLFEHIICAICEQESSWEPHVMRYEPGFRTRYVARLGLTPTEEVARSISWGLMQVMGQSARELGFAGPLPSLCDPETGIDWGCRVFELKLRHALGSYEQALNLWNGGGNPDYAAQVLTKAERYRTS